MINILDHVAASWLNWRTVQSIKNDPSFQGVELERANFEKEDDKIRMLMNHPSICYLAEEAASLLKELGAENYVEFNFSPNIDKALKPVRVTVQWAEGLSPAAKNVELDRKLSRLQGAVDDLLRLIEEHGNLVMRAHATRILDARRAVTNTRVEDE